MKILITGGSGLLGQYLNITLTKNHDILTLYNSNKGNCTKYNSLKIDLTDFKYLNDIISSFKPQIIIHTAAISRPELCDQLSLNYVTTINTELAKQIAEICELKDIKLIFTSTDLIYDGNKGSMLTEESELNPVSLYAETKLDAENELKKVFENYIILRTSLLYGLGLNHASNNFHSMYNSLKKNQPVNLFYDQFRTPLALHDASRLMEQLVNLQVNNIILNFGGSERVSRVELGEILCKVGKFDISLINKISMDDIAGLHKVADVSMDTQKLNSLGLKQRSIEQSIIEMIVINH